MIYPRDIVEVLVKTRKGYAPLLSQEGRSSVNVSAAPQPEEGFSVEEWMIENERTCKEVSRFLGYLRFCRERFIHVAHGMGYANVEASHSLGHDKWSVGWAGSHFTIVAAYLYILKSYGLDGNVLECGAFKGSSTACLSWACHRLGIKLHSADSFEGLPGGEGHYKKGDFSGSLEEVRANVKNYGRLEAVEFIKGWYRTSLKDYRSEISLLWVDVDLQQSVLDILENIFPKLHRNAVVFSDGFAPEVDFEGGGIRFTGGEPAGFFRFFNDGQIPYKAIPAGPRGLALIVPHCRREEAVLFDPQKFSCLLQSLDG